MTPISSGTEARNPGDKIRRLKSTHDSDLFRHRSPQPGKQNQTQKGQHMQTQNNTTDTMRNDKDTPLRTALIIHGHFYQPPREDPFTGVYPAQPSADPFPDWNEAVYKTCYEPNAFSRYLNTGGKIEHIYNNYENISFNFGPTLLKWIDEKHPRFMQRLIDADKSSIARLGHSNIIAQTYNHTILPLESTENKRIQISWAVEDYARRFGHAPEGFWCAECAIDEETVDLLSEAGIKYTILSPWQAKSIGGKDLEGGCAPYDRPFLLRGRNRSIAAFFYNGDFASGISFGHLLRDADALYRNISEYRRSAAIQSKTQTPPALLHWATDGEIYGHHEPFGDMALAALCKKVQDGEDFYLTNYGAYLEAHPPVEEARLYLGEDGRGSSWSCSHGVKRWYTDCGCHTGGDEKWNQKWRTPLREAFKKLEMKARTIFRDEVRKIYGPAFDTERFLTEYGRVLSGRITAHEYVSRAANEARVPLCEESASRALVLLECMKNVFFSFTSCGWFFNDISGIEPTQNIKYAYYAARTLSRLLNRTIKTAAADPAEDEKPSGCEEPTAGGISAGRDLAAELKEDLALARGNTGVTGADILEKAEREKPGEIKACGFFALKKRMYEEDPNREYRYGIFRLLGIDGHDFKIENTETLQRHTYRATEIHDDKAGTIRLIFTNIDTGCEVEAFLPDTPVDFLKEISSEINKKIVANYTVEVIRNLSGYLSQLHALSRLRIDAINNLMIQENIVLFIKVLYSDCFYSDAFDSRFRQNYIRLITELTRIAGGDKSRASIRQFYNEKMKSWKRDLRKNMLTDESTERYIWLLEMARENGITVDITSLQNWVWYLIEHPEERPISPEAFGRLKLYLNFA